MIEDAREIVFPIFSVPAEGDGIYLEARQFLGTAFFVSRRGDAITAHHVLPPPEQVKSGHRLVAVVVRDGREQVCWITQAAPFPCWDLSLLHVNLDDCRFLPLSAAEVVGGMDIQFIGIPDHEVWGAGREMRLLKGHVSMTVGPWLELSCAVPRGMSGSPLFVRDHVVGCVVGTFRTEELEDALEETVEVSAARELRRTVEVRRVCHYGKAFGFKAACATAHPVLNNQTLFAFLEGRNREP